MVLYNLVRKIIHFNIVVVQFSSLDNGDLFIFIFVCGLRGVASVHFLVNDLSLSFRRKSILQCISKRNLRDPRFQGQAFWKIWPFHRSIWKLNENSFMDFSYILGIYYDIMYTCVYLLMTFIPPGCGQKVQV